MAKMYSPQNVVRGSEAAGQIIAQAGQRSLDREQQSILQAQHLDAARQQQQMQIDAQAMLQKQAADIAFKKMAVQSGLESQIREQEFDRELVKMQEGAKLQAQQWEYQYSAKQRQEVARLNNGLEEIMRSNAFSEEEKLQAKQLIQRQMGNIQPSAMPRDLSKPIYPEGKEPGSTWLAEDGLTLLGRDMAGKTQLLVRPDQTPQYAQQKVASELQKSIMQERMKAIFTLASEEIEYDTGEKDERGKAVAGFRRRNSSELQEIIRAADQAIGLGSQETAEGRQPAQEEKPWWDTLTEQGVAVTDADKQLPASVGVAQAIYRQLLKRYQSRDGVPKHLQPQFDRAAQIIMAYQGQ